MSKLINKTRLKKFAEGFWTKIKDRYDDAFVGATLTATEKKIKFTKKKGGPTVDVDLADYARLTDRNEFKKDVSVDDAKIVSNKNIGQLNGPVVANTRTTGYRSLSSASFTDGYVKTLRIYAPTDGAASANFHIWTIKKGETKTQDKLLENKKVSRANIVEGDGVKYYDISIERKYTDDVFFVVRTDSVGANIEGINQLKAEIVEDVINLNDRFNPTVVDALTNWSDYEPIYTLASHMELHGRTGIVDISKRLDEIDTASGNYVKHSETTATGGTASANKVVKLDGQGKLDKDMLPSIAINEYFEITDFTNQALQGKRYENGDVAVVTGSGANSGKRYLCINKGTSNATTEFIELNSKDGSVLSVNERTGAVELNLEATEDKFKLKISGTGGTEVVKELDMISEDEITNIITSLS